MGGSVGVTSAPGRGARFTVIVPVQVLPEDASSSSDSVSGASAQHGAMRTVAQFPAETASTVAASTPDVAPRAGTAAAAGHDAAAASSPPDSPLSGPTSPRRMRVLLVEDHALNARLCKKLLESKGAMDVVAADDGDVALKWLTDSYASGGPQPVDLVLMDSASSPAHACSIFASTYAPLRICAAVQMPRMDGVTATRHFRAWEREHRPDAPKLPIIALSANVFDDAVAECSRAGMDGAPLCRACCDALNPPALRAC